MSVQCLYNIITLYKIEKWWRKLSGYVQVRTYAHSTCENRWALIRIIICSGRFLEKTAPLERTHIPNFRAKVECNLSGRTFERVR